MIDPKKIVVGAIVLVLQRWRRYAQALAVPFALYCCLEVIFYLKPELGVMIATVFVGTLIHVMYALTTHRLVLLGDDSVPQWGLNAWTRRESTFLARIVAVVLCIAPAGMLKLVPGIGWILSSVAAFWIAGRVSLVFPAVAIGQDCTIACSWHLSKRHQLQLAITMGAFPVLMLGPILILNQLPMGSLLAGFFESLATVFTFAALSLAYREVVRREGGT